MNKDSIRKWGVIGFIILAIIVEIFRPKTFEVVGIGEGFHGPITVKMRVKKDGEKYKILDVIVEHKDSPEIAGPIVEELKRRILSKQTPDVDGYAGSSYTSRGVLQGAKKAYEKLK